MDSICIVLLFSVFMMVTANPSNQTGPTHGKIIVCNGYTNRMIDPSSDTARFEDIDLNFCTHLHAIDWKSHSQKDFWDLTIADKELYEKLTNLKQKYPHLKILMTIGNHFLTKYFNYSQHSFVEKTTNFVTNNDFDGINLDFGYNYKAPIQPKDFTKMVSMVKELSENFHESNLTLTSTHVFKENLTDSYNYAALSEFIDFMTFQRPFYGSKDEISNSLQISKLEEKIRKIIASGVSPSKILMDLYFIGYKFKKSNDLSISRNNLLGYNEICHLSNDESKWEKSYDTETGLAFLKNRNENDSINEIVFENPRSMANRVLLGMNLNLTGFEAVLVHSDDFHGECGIDHDTFDDFKSNISISTNLLKREFPLLRTIEKIITEQIQPEKDNGMGMGTASIPMMKAYHMIFVIVFSGLALKLSSI